MEDKPDFIRAFDAIMQERVTSSPEEHQAAVDEFAAKGWGLAAISNYGLPAGQARLTFVPESHTGKLTGEMVALDMKEPL